jgi:tRNA nucleotidyltransferase/poly(A) polymerase
VTKQSIISNFLHSGIFLIIKEIAAVSGAEVFLVGGAVRDLIRCVPFNDLDFVVFKTDYILFAKQIAKKLKRPFVPFKDNVRIPCKNGYIDISAPRGVSLEEDLSRRDFTVNNLAMDLNGNITGDPADINNKVIRPAYGNAFYDDPLRILRGFRHAASFNYTLSDEFFALAVSAVSGLSNTAGERLLDELKKLSAVKANIQIYTALCESEIWINLFGFNPNDFLLYKVMEGSAPYGKDEKFALFLAALLTENEGRTAPLLKRLCVSNNTADFVKMLLKQSAAIYSATSEEIKKIIWRAGDNFGILLYYTAIRYSLPEERISVYNSVAAILNRKYAETADGNILLRLIGECAPDMPHGRWIADILEETKIKLAFGELNGREEAEEYMSLKIKMSKGK